MKKTILATSLALGLGVTGVVADQETEASSINKEELAQTAQNNPAELNAAPIHEGAYDYNFTLNNVNYDFSSDGNSYSWAYSANGNATATNYTNETVEAPKVEEIQVEEVQEVEQTNYTEYNTQETQTQQAAPAVEEKQEVSQPAAPAPTQSTSSSNGSTKSQFLAAGGTEAMWNNIVLPESGGNPSAVSPNGYQGLGQTKESWGTGSVADQTSGMLNYAKQRYGSIDNAIQFRNANNWW